uniref:Uncharacterized protein n=1 Tax=Anopheles quadriannulatus TaxID=34691 RepID=A0A182XTW1_ANOQN
MRHAYAASVTETAETFSLHWCCCRW